MRSSIKTVTLFFFFLIHKVCSISGNIPSVSVLMYHSILNGGWKYSVKEADFEKQIEYLNSKYKIITVYDVINYIKGNLDIDTGSVVLTFDDGYEDIYTTVFPIIKKYNIPITIFLTTNLEKSAKLGGLPRLNWNQCREMKESCLVSFEVHGRGHLNLVTISNNDDKLREEILGSVDDIQKNLNYTPKVIAYASGYKNEKVIRFLNDNDFLAGFSINEGLTRMGDDIFAIKRIQVDGTIGFNLFKMRLTPAIDLNRRYVDSFRRLYAKKA